MPSKAKETGGGFEIRPPQTDRIKLFIQGTAPLIYNAMSFKARCELLSPRGRLSAVEKATKLKHEPENEYRDSVYAHPETSTRPTRLYFPAGGFKRGMTTAALELPGVSKASLNRLLLVEPRDVDIYGTPKLLMSVTRAADMKRTPIIRTRAILEQWAAIVEVEFAIPQLNEDAIGNLMNAAGTFCGLGDWRIEKGGGYGRYRVSTPGEIAKILEQGQHEQDTALATPQPYDTESEKLLAWYAQELINRRTRVRPLKKEVA